MKNTKVKQMLVSVILDGRKAIWYGEDSEVYAANSLEQIEDHFRECLDGEDCTDEHKNVISSNWRYWWTPCVSEKECKKGKLVTKGTQVKSTITGKVMEQYERLPLICGVYGSAKDISQVLTSYN